jgi:hypothetical protein
MSLSRSRAEPVSSWARKVSGTSTIAAAEPLQVQRADFIDAEDHLRFPFVRDHLAVGDRVQVPDPGFLHRVLRVLGGLPGLYVLKGDALLAKQQAQALLADVVDHPLGHKELRQRRQAPHGERQVMLSGAGLGDLLDLPPLRQGKLRWAAAAVLRAGRASSRCVARRPTG